MQRRHLIKPNISSLYISKQTVYEWNTPQHTKCCIQQVSSEHRAEWDKAERLLSKIWSNTRMANFTTFIQCSSEVLTRAIGKKKKKKMASKSERTKLIVSVCRWQDPRLHQRPKRTGKLRSAKLQDQSQHAKISTVMHQEWIIWKKAIKQVMPFPAQ